MNEPAEGPAPIRWGARRRGRRRRWRPLRMTPFAMGVLVMLLSVTTCSSGVEVAALAEEYGPPVPATREAALGFVTRTSAAFREAPSTRRLSFQVTESEATSALSLGLMIPELMLAMQSMTQDEVQAFNDLAELRDHLHIRATGGGGRGTVQCAPVRSAPVRSAPVRRAHGGVRLRLLGAGPQRPGSTPPLRRRAGPIYSGRGGGRGGVRAGLALEAAGAGGVRPARPERRTGARIPARSARAYPGTPEGLQRPSRQFVSP